MKTFLEFKFCAFHFEAEWNNGNIQCSIWKFDASELLFTFDFDIDKVDAPESDTVFLHTGYSFEPKELTVPLNHYSTGFEYCEEDVKDFIIQNQKSWQNYTD